MCNTPPGALARHLEVFINRFRSSRPASGRPLNLGPETSKLGAGGAREVWPVSSFTVSWWFLAGLAPIQQAGDEPSMALEVSANW